MSHPLEPLIELLNNVDTSNDESIIQFVKENKKFQLQMQDTLLKDHINRQRVEQGKQAKDMLEIGADDAIPFRIGLVLDYLETLEPSDAKQLCEKVATISEKTCTALEQREFSRKVGVELWGEEHGFLTSVETAFEASKIFEFKFPEDDENLHEVQKSLKAHQAHQDEIFRVLLENLNNKSENFGQNLKQSIDNGFDINHQDASNSTLLHNAFQSGSYKNIQFLLDMNASSEVKNSDGKTPRKSVSLLSRMRYSLRSMLSAVGDLFKSKDKLSGDTTMSDEVEPIANEQQNVKKEVTVLSEPSIIEQPKAASLLQSKRQVTFISDSVVGVKNKRPDPMSSKDLLIQQCVNELQNALDWKISVGDLPDFCQPDVSVQEAKEAIESMQEKLIDMGSSDEVSAKDIKAAVLDVGVGAIFKAESPIKSLSDSMDTLQSAKSKIKPGGSSAPAA